VSQEDELGEVTRDFNRLVGTAAIHNNDFDVGRAGDKLERIRDVPLFIQGRNYDGD
jgi:hypothetical protein